MIDKDLIELQSGNLASCAIINNEGCDELKNAFIMNADISDADLFGCSLRNPIFRKELDKICENKEDAYFIIKGIDKIDIEMQNRYLGLVKDREFMGYNLPENIVIIFTVKDKEALKKVSTELYHFSVVAF